MNVRRALRAASALTLSLLALAGVARAHPLSPALLELEEGDEGIVAVRWITSTVKLPGAEYAPVLPAHCRPLSASTSTVERGRLVQAWAVDCADGGLVGRRVGVEGLASAHTDALLRITLADGRSTRSVLRAREPFAVVPERESRRAVANAYGRLGVEHILTGWDHLLFVFGLLLLVEGFGRLVKTVTAFTLGHSVTLSFATLGYVPSASALIEVAIAVSIFVLAVELTRAQSEGATLFRRRPWLIAAGFGLLHGAGFAGALREVGLPGHEIPLALFAFNVGIELGQLLFIAFVLVARRALGPVVSRGPAWLEQVPIYALGCLSVCWTLERIAALAGS